MTVHDAKTIIKNLTPLANKGWVPKMFFAMSGEPLMNKDLPEILCIFRERFKESNIAIISNGDFLGKIDADAVFDEIDIMIVDAYTESAKQRVFEVCKEKELNCVDFYADWALRKISPFSNLRRKFHRTVCVIADLKTNSGKVASRKLHNYGGNVPLIHKKLLMKKICVNPVRELVIKHDGTVTICCMDVGNEFVAGNLTKEPVEKIWFSAPMESARKLLRRGNRAFSPCAFCTACLPGSFAITSSFSLPYPQSKDYTIIKDHLKSLDDSGLETKNGRKRFSC